MIRDCNRKVKIRPLPDFRSHLYIVTLSSKNIHLQIHTALKNKITRRALDSKCWGNRGYEKNRNTRIKFLFLLCLFFIYLCKIIVSVIILIERNHFKSQESPLKSCKKVGHCSRNVLHESCPTRLFLPFPPPIWFLNGDHLRSYSA
jgi:hypothetical protein